MESDTRNHQKEHDVSNEKFSTAQKSYVTVAMSNIQKVNLNRNKVLIMKINLLVTIIFMGI